MDNRRSKDEGFVAPQTKAPDARRGPYKECRADELLKLAAHPVVCGGIYKNRSQEIAARNGTPVRFVRPKF